MTRFCAKASINHFILSLIILTIMSFLGCNSDQKEKETIHDPIVSTFYLIRHAEKDRSNLNDMDPELSQDGMGRSMRWAEIFESVPLDAIYTTNFKRTEMTAAPTSVKYNIDIQYYNANTLDIETLKGNHIGENVLIVGHSNTIPHTVNELLGEEKYSDMLDDDNASLYIVRIIDDEATDIVLKMD